MLEPVHGSIYADLRAAMEDEGAGVVLVLDKAIADLRANAACIEEQSKDVARGFDDLKRVMPALQRKFSKSQEPDTADAFIKSRQALEKFQEAAKEMMDAAHSASVLQLAMSQGLDTIMRSINATLELEL